MSTALAPITSQDAPEQLSWRSFRTKPSNRPEPELLTMSIGTSATVGYVDLHSASRVRLLKAATLRDLFGAVGPPPMRGLVSQLIQEHVEGLWAPTQQVVNVLDLLPLNAGSWEPSVTTYTVTVRLNEAARVIGAAFEPLTADRAIEAALEPLRTLHTIEAAFEPLRLVQGGTMPVIGRHRASAALPSAPTAPPTSAAFRAFSELRGWLLLTADEAADLIGVGRTTPNAWARSGFEPRPKTARVLYQLHTTLRALVHRLGEDEAQRWLESGSPSPRDVLLSSDRDRFVAAVEERLGLLRFATAPEAGSLIESDAVYQPLAPSSAPRRTRTRIRRRPRS